VWSLRWWVRIASRCEHTLPDRGSPTRFQYVTKRVFPRTLGGSTPRVPRSLPKSFAPVADRRKRTRRVVVVAGYPLDCNRISEALIPLFVSPPH